MTVVVRYRDLKQITLRQAGGPSQFFGQVII